MVDSFWETKSETARMVAPVTVQRRSWLPETR
jgi:hypothetical protein